MADGDVEKPRPIIERLMQAQAKTTTGLRPVRSDNAPAGTAARTPLTWAAKKLLFG